MLRCLLLLSLLTLGTAAAGLGAPDSVTVEPGRFASILITSDEPGELEVVAPPFLRLSGTPELRAGRALVNLLAEREAPAGATLVTIRLHTADGRTAETQVRLIVTTRVGFDLIVPDGRTVVAGARVAYPLRISNTGNAADRYLIEVRSSLPYRVDPARLELGPAESGTVTLYLEADDRRTDVAMVRVESVGDPNIARTDVITTVIQPFAGAQAIDGPALMYDLAAGTAYGTPGLEYLLGARLAGALSEYVQVGSDLTFAGSSLTGRLDLAGPAWGIGYRGSAAMQRLEGSIGSTRGFLTVPVQRGGFSAGVSHAAGPLNTSLTHTTMTTGEQRDTLRFGYGLSASQDVTLTPSVGLTGSGSYGADYRVSGLFGLGLRAQLPTWNANAQFDVTLPGDPATPWSLTAGLGNRVQAPVGINGQITVKPNRFDTTLFAREVITAEFVLSQRLRYGQAYGEPGTLGGNFTATYRPRAAPVSLTGTLQGRLRGGEAQLGYGLGAAYAPGNLAFEVAFEQLDGIRFGAGISYAVDALELIASYQLAPNASQVALGAAGSVGGFQASVLGGYDFAAANYGGRVDLGYSFSSRFDTFGSLALDAGELQFRVGGSVRTQGGFATPDALVDLFGGRTLGFLEGAVFVDEDRNGVRDPSDRPVGGVLVRAGTLTAETDPEGRFRLALPPGEHRITVSNLAAEHELAEPLEVTVASNSVQTVDLPLRTVASLTGVVFEDSDRDGQLGDEATLPYATVVLTSVEGSRWVVRADDGGRFFFQGLAPGRYTVALDPDSLPAFFEPSTPPLELTLEPGPFPRLALGAAPRERAMVMTHSANDMTLNATVSHMSAPPGADVRVTAEVTGSPADVAVRLNGVSTPLPATSPGVFEAFVTLPATLGVANLEVVASDGAREVSRSLIVLLTPGDLARVHIQPSVAEPSETVTIAAEFLTRVAGASVVIGDARFDLQQDATYAFSGAAVVPDQPGSYQLELWADGERFAVTRFLVAD